MPRKRGPAPTVGTAEQKSTVSVRITPALKDKLVAAMRMSDRSMSQEAEVRLELSFAREGTVIEVLDHQYGRWLAGLVLLIANVMYLSSKTAMISVLTSEDLKSYFEIAKSKLDDWHREPFAYDQAVRAAHAILEAFRPEGDLVTPKWGDPKAGEKMANAAAGMIKTGKYDHDAFQMLLMGQSLEYTWGRLGHGSRAATTFMADMLKHSVHHFAKKEK
jgi:hypothetical protein